MNRVVRPGAVFLTACAVTVAAGSQLAHEVSSAPHGVVDPLRPFTGGGRPMTAGFGSSPGVAWDLSRLKIVEPTLYHVEESYVEPGRIDWEAMYVGALEAVERAVPACKFTRDPGRVSVEIDAFRTVLEVPPVGSSHALQQELRKVAALLQAHLDPAEVPPPPGDLPQKHDALAQVEYTLVNGILDTLDPHSILLPPADAIEMDVENQGEFGGLGITIVERDGRLVVEYPIPDTPASEAGILKDDVVTRIDGQSTLNMSLDEAVTLLRGPVGDPVELEVTRESFAGPRKYELVRKLIRLNEVDGQLIDGDIGVIRIQSFHSNVERELHEVLTRLHRASRDGLKGVVLDLRDNPGGYLNQAVAVADTFLASGQIVSTIDGNGRKQDSEEASADSQTEPDYPLVVLQNSNSASASEIVAGALRNNERAVIVGERSFGKGSVQNLHQFYDESKLKLTISKYLTPGDHSIQAVGIPADIELVPVRVEERASGPTLALMYWRERVRREADLDHSLARSALREDDTAYSFHYLQSPDAADPSLDTSDPQVRFARDLILGAHSSRRGEMLGDAARLVDTWARKGDAEVVAAMRGLGIDWTNGSSWTGTGLPVRVSLDLGADGAIVAGEKEQIAVAVTNTSPVTLYRVGVVAADNDVLAGREFLIGRLEPGETRRYAVEVNLVDGVPAERGPVRLIVRDAGSAPLGDVAAEVVVTARPRPDLVWSWRWEDTIGGDGDGIAEVGETVGLELTVENRGEGWTGAAFARLRNLNGRALDLGTGTLEPGTVRDISGAACASVGERKGCQPRLAPAETWTGRLTMDLREARAEGWDLELTLGDGEAYDHGSVVRGGFYEHFTQKTALHLDGEVALPAPARREAPSIELSRVPGAVEEDARVTLSGVVGDDTGVRHVMVFGAGDKLFFEGSDRGVRSVPFTADVPLEPGANVITVIARDLDGFVSTRSVITHRPDPEALAVRTGP